jgi:ABC-type cobalamin/Fe3+-siderophores transport system ATPase subunit
MPPSAKETKRKREGEQVLPSSHKRKKREAGGASAEKTANQGEDSTKRAKRVDAFSTGKTASKTGAGKTRASTKTTSDSAAHSTARTGKADQISQDVSGECQEMERVLRLVEQQASTIARDEPLSIKEVDQAYDALLKMHKRWGEASVNLAAERRARNSN